MTYQDILAPVLTDDALDSSVIVITTDPAVSRLLGDHSRVEHDGLTVAAVTRRCGASEN